MTPTMTVHGITTLLEVFDMRSSMAFYQTLGFEVVHTSESDEGEVSWALLRFGGAELMLNSAYDEGQRPSEPDRARAAGHADTELFVNCSNADEAYRWLRAKGCHVTPPETTHYGMQQTWTNDPDGFRICFQSPAEV